MLQTKVIVVFPLRIRKWIISSFSGNNNNNLFNIATPVAIGIYYEGVEIIILPSSQMDQKFMSTIRVNKLVSRSKS